MKAPSPMHAHLLEFDVAPYRLSGTVYGTLLNHRPALQALGAAAEQPPYKAAPKAPVLYVKPRNTLVEPDGDIVVPASAERLQVGAALGLVIGRTACRVAPDQALDHLAGFTAVIDYSVPHASFYRPSVRFKAMDASCCIGPRVASRSSIANPDRLGVRVHVDGVCVHTTSTSDMVRDAARLLADVSDFMTLAPGDVLLLGVAEGAPLAGAGQRVAVEIDGIGRLENTLVQEAA